MPIDETEAREEKRAWLWREGQATVFLVFVCLGAFAAIFIGTGGLAYLATLIDYAPAVEQQQPEQ